MCQPVSHTTSCISCSRISTGLAFNLPEQESNQHARISLDIQLWLTCIAMRVLQNPTPLQPSRIITWIFANHTKICTTIEFHYHIHNVKFLYSRYAHLLIDFWNVNGYGSDVYLSVIHFRGFRIRQVSCYTLHCGFQLPWPPPWYQYTDTLFVVSFSIILRLLTVALGSSRIASSAYQKWPTRYWKLDEKQLHGNSEFADRWRVCPTPRTSRQLLYLHEPVLNNYLLSWGKLRWEPATRWFDWSFAPMLKFNDQFAR